MSKKYPIKCPSCDGYGSISNGQGMHTSAIRTCPACNGNKFVIVEEDEPTHSE